MTNTVERFINYEMDKSDRFSHYVELMENELEHISDEHCKELEKALNNFNPLDAEEAGVKAILLYILSN